MIEDYWLGNISMGVSANPRSGRITIHETKRNLVQYHSINISTLVVGVLWVIANEILATLRENLSQWICEQFWSKRSPDSQKSWYTTMSHGTIYHTQEIYWENTTGRLPLFRWEAQEKWVGGRLCIGFSCRWWIFRIGNTRGWRLLVFYVLSLSKLRDFWVVKTSKYAIHSPCRQCWV